MTFLQNPIPRFSTIRLLLACFVLASHFGSGDGMAIGKKLQNGSSGNRLLNRRKYIGDMSLSILCAVELPGKAAVALSPEEAAKAYDSYAATYDDLDGGKAASVLGIDEARDALFSEASGSVLEIGAGTGLNLDKYDLSKVSSITLVDVSAGMLNEARKRVQGTPALRDFPVSYVKADATSDLVDICGQQKFDCVTGSFFLCVMGTDGAKQCLNQVRQVVKSRENGGKVLLLENSRSSNPVLGYYQDFTANIAADVGGRGCVMNQDVVALIRSTDGMVIESERQYAAGLFRAYTCVVG